MKLPPMGYGGVGDLSPPARGRGLKRVPFGDQNDPADWSPPARGRGLKLIKRSGAELCFSRPPRGGVDRNHELRSESNVLTVAPRAGAWIETPHPG